MTHASNDDFNQVRARAHSLGLSAEEMLRDSLKALAGKDRSPAERVLAERPSLSQKIDALHEELFTVVALQQPLPRDMAEISCIFCMTMSMERVGRYAEEIARVAAAFPPGREPGHVFSACAIPRMADEACAMVHDSLDAFISLSLDPIARHVIRNEEIQAMGAGALRAGLERMAREPREIKNIERALHVIRAIEGSAANSTMAAEKVHLFLTGKGLETTEIPDRFP